MLKYQLIKHTTASEQQQLLNAKTVVKKINQVLCWLQLLGETQSIVPFFENFLQHLHGTGVYTGH